MRDGQAQFVPMTLADKLMGVIGAQVILAALIKAVRTGVGCTLDAGMFEGDRLHPGRSSVSLCFSRRWGRPGMSG